MFEAILSRMSQAPVLVAQESETVFVAGIQRMVEHFDAMPQDRQQEFMDAAYDEDFWPEEGSWLNHYRPYNVVNGVLTIPVAGSLINNFGYTLNGWVTGYTYVWKAVERGMADPEVKGIVFRVNSPGGEVSGNFDLVDYIAQHRGNKPMLAVASDHAYSAAYNIAAAADEIHVSRTGGVGSIGVVTMHLDLSEYMKKMGIQVTFIHAGKHKVDGNPYQPLPEDVKKRMQSRIDGLYNIFVSSVAQNRDMEEQAVRATEALTYSAEEGVEIGLADAVSSFDDSLTAFAGKLASSNGAFQMSKDNGNAPAATSEADKEALAQARQEGVDAGKAEGFAEGQKAERERVQGIMGCEAAENRQSQALNLAMKTGLSVDEASAVLEGMQEEGAGIKGGGQGGHFDKAMGQDNPNIQAAVDGEDGEELSDSAAIMRDFCAASGEKPASAAK